MNGPNDSISVREELRLTVEGGEKCRERLKIIFTFRPPSPSLGRRRPNGFLGLSLNVRTFLFLVILGGFHLGRPH